MRPVGVLLVSIAGFLTCFLADAQPQSSSAGTLLAGQDLRQDIPLFSTDGTVFLMLQSTGSLLLFDAAAAAKYGMVYAAAIYNTSTSGTTGPFLLAMQQDCNLVVYGNGGLARNGANAIFETATYNQGTGPCTLIVSGEGGGGFGVADANGITLYSAGSYSPGGTPKGTLPAGQDLVQEVKLFSADSTAYLKVQSDGNLVLYSTDLVSKVGSSAASALYDSATYGSTPAPFVLAMQKDCNLVLYDAGGSIRNAGAAVFASNTYAQLVQAALPCHLTVSGARGGFIAVVDGLGNTVFMRPQLPPLLATSLSSYHTPFFATATQPVVFVASLFTAGIPGGPDGQGLPIAGAVILVNPGDGSPVLMAKTNSSGTAAIEHAYTSLDVFNAAISYRGDVTYAPAQTNQTVEVAPAPTMISLVITPGTFTDMKPNTYTSTLRAATPGFPPLAGQNVSIRAQGNGYFFGATDANGVFEVTVTYNASDPVNYGNTIYTYFKGTCGQCNAPSPGVHTPSFTTLYTSGAPVMLSLYLTPATPVVGQPTNLTALARSGVAPFAPLPNASLYILPSIGEEIVTSGYNYNGITGSDGTFTITVQYNIDGQYYPGASLNYFDNIDNVTYATPGVFLETNSRLITNNVRPFNNFLGTIYK